MQYETKPFFTVPLPPQHAPFSIPLHQSYGVPSKKPVPGQALHIDDACYCLVSIGVRGGVCFFGVVMALSALQIRYNIHELSEWVLCLHARARLGWWWATAVDERPKKCLLSCSMGRVEGSLHPRTVKC